MKKILFMALAAITMFTSCSEGDNQGADNGKPKSLEFSLGLEAPKGRMSDGTVTGTQDAVAKAVLDNIKTVTIQFYTSGGAFISETALTDAQVAQLKGSSYENQTSKPVIIENIPTNTDKVNAILNRTSTNDINLLQNSYITMEYSGKIGVDAQKITQSGETINPSTGNALYRATIEVKPVMARFEYKGNITVSSVGVEGELVSGKQLPETTDRSKAEALVSEGAIVAAETAAKNAWKAAHPDETTEPTWILKYTVVTKYDAQYKINGINGYYMNYIRSDKSIATTDVDKYLVKNKNDGSGQWDEASGKTYTEATGIMRKMWDSKVDDKKVIAYNLFPQSVTATNLVQVKAAMPHLILKLDIEGTVTPKWITIRAFRQETPAGFDGVIKSFDAGSVYVLDAANIVVNQYTSYITVDANGSTSTTPDPKDPTDPNPEPEAKDLEVLVKIMPWNVVNIKPEW